jgi:RimJ/RimL family protein N-acetyltransferase
VSPRQAVEIDAGPCRLRRWRREDLDALLRHADDPMVARNLRDLFPSPYTRADAREWLTDPLHEIDPPTAFAIDVDGEAVGGIGLSPGRDVERFSAEVGYWLGEAFWGRGLATAALRAATEYGFSRLNLHRIFALPFAHNAASSRVLAKTGYVLEARLVESAYKEGVFVDQELWAALAPTWRGILPG